MSRPHSPIGSAIGSAGHDVPPPLSDRLRAGKHPAVRVALSGRQAQQRRSRPLRKRRVPFGQRAAEEVDETPGAPVLGEFPGKEVLFGKGTEKGHAEVQMVGEPFVVGVQERDVLSTCAKHGGVPRRIHALVLLPDQDETGVRALDQIGRVVGRTVVHHDQFPIRESLPLHACDRGLDRLPAVIGRDDHGDEAHRGDSWRAGCLRSTIPSFGSRVTWLAAEPLLIAGS